MLASPVNPLVPGGLRFGLRLPAALLGAAALALSGCGDDRSADGGLAAPAESLEVFAGQDEAAAEPAGPMKIPPGIQRFFAELEEATMSPESRRVTEFFSVDGMVDALRDAGHLRGMGRSQVAAFRTGLEGGLDNVGGMLEQMAFDRHRIVRVDDLGNDRHLVYVRTDDSELNVSSHYRWWMVRDGDRWKAYDFEEMDIGWRFMEIAGLVLKGMMADVPEPWVEDFAALAMEIQGVDLTDPDTLLALVPLLEQARTHELPVEINRFVSVLTAAAHLVDGDAEASMAELQAARDGGYDSAMYHYQMGDALLLLERYDEALEHFSRHAEILGWNPGLLEAVSEAHLLSGDRVAAREAALRGLEDNPAAIRCMAALAAASTVEEIRPLEFREVFAAASDVEWAYEMAMDYLLELGHEAEARALLWHLRGEFPKSYLVAYYIDTLKGATGRL